MAWRCDAGGDDLRRTASLPSAASFTACGWLRLQALSAGASTFVSIAQSTTQLGLQFSSAGVLVLTSAADVNFARSPPAGQWFFWALKCSGTGANLAAGYFRKLREGYLTKALGTRSAITPDTLWFMNNASAEPTNGRIAGIKVWDAVLTDAEILRESFQLAPVRRYRLHLWAQENTGADLSGRSRTLTKTGTLTFEPGPPIPLFANQPVILDHVATSGNVTGTVGVTEANDTSAASGTVTVTGTIAATEANDTSAASGAVIVTGTIAANEAADSVSAAGAITVTGSIAASEQNDSSSASGAITVSGSIAVTEQNDSCSAAGSIPVDVTGTVAVTEANDSSAITGTVTVTGSIAVSEANDTVVASGSVVAGVSGSVAVTEQDDSSSASGTITVTGSISVTEANDIASAFGNVAGGTPLVSFYPIRARRLLRR